MKREKRRERREDETAKPLNASHDLVAHPHITTTMSSQHRHNTVTPRPALAGAEVRLCDPRSVIERPDGQLLGSGIRQGSRARQGAPVSPSPRLPRAPVPPPHLCWKLHPTCPDRLSSCAFRSTPQHTDSPPHPPHPTTDRGGCGPDARWQAGLSLITMVYEAQSSHEEMQPGTWCRCAVWPSP